jgi:glucokinase
MRNTVSIGIDIGGTNTVYGFITEDGSVIDSEEIPTRGDESIINLIDRLDSRIKIFFEKKSDTKLLGIGIGAPNGNHFSGRIQDPPNLSWGDVDIVSLFKERFNCDTILTNDANAAALGEKSYGVAQDMNDFIVITLGTGLGSGIFSGGKLVYGYDGFAGEMGHMPIEFGGRSCNCGNEGCLESYASASGIKKTVQELLKSHPEDTFLKSISLEKIDGITIDNAFDSGNEIAKKIYEYTGEHLGRGLAQAANLLSPEAFIFYGGFSNAGERLLNPAKKSMDKYLINGHAETINLLQSGLPKGQAGILGAASLIWTKT